MALIITRAVSSLQPHARQLLLVQAGRVQASVLPSTTQVAHLTSTHGEPSKCRHPPWPYKKRPYNSFYQFFDRTRKRFDDNTKVIVIDGNLAVGKSWFGEKVAKEFDMKFFPDPRDSTIFQTGENFDLRSLNEQLPPRVRFTDLETFYSQNAPKEQLETIGRTLISMYMSSFFEYVNALEHLLNTGQGVVVERGVFSHMVFHNVFRKMGLITAPALKYLTFLYDNTICEMWRPHLVIHLDAPFPFLRKLVNKRNVRYEVNGPVITDEFLMTVDKVYKEKYLPVMGKYSDVLTYDLSDMPDWEIIVEELETRNLDTKPFDDEDKFKDWQSTFDNDYNGYRMNLAKKWQVNSLFSMPVPWDAPEMLIPNDLIQLYTNVVGEHPEVKYAPGYNPEINNVLFK